MGSAAATTSTTSTAEIDWELWSFLVNYERGEATPSWTDLVSLEGLDLSHPGDMDWVCRAAGMAAE